MEEAAHFSSDGHQLSNTKFVELEKVWRGRTTYWRMREQRWVGLLNTHRKVDGLKKKIAYVWGRTTDFVVKMCLFLVNILITIM